MIKGVNKQVLEINETQSGFFEKAIFFVKPEYSGFSEGKLRESAVETLEKAGRPPRTHREKSKTALKAIGLIVFSLALGILIGRLF